jgi:uncharacterized protein
MGTKIMLMRKDVYWMVIVSLALSAFAADAAQFGTREEAVAMVKRVQEKFKKDGPAATFAAVTGQVRPFHDRDLYPYILSFDCVVQAHGAQKSLVGKNIYDFRDQDGKFVPRETVSIAKTLGHGWLDFRWKNPVTGQVDAKSTYIELLGDKYAVGVGIYKDEQINRNTVSIISGSPGSDATYLQVAYDLAAVLSDGENLRVLPVVGIGGPQNIRDVRTLKGIDIGLTQTSILNNFRRANETLGVQDDKIVYVAKLFNLEFHLVVRSDINSLDELKDQKVNFDEVGSGTNYSARDVFKRLGINVEEVNLTQVRALEKLKSGEIAATVLVAGKPTQSMSQLKASDNIKFLPIAFSKPLETDFLPTKLTHEDYPNMIPEGQEIATIADGAVLISYNWPKDSERYQRIETFVNAFFPRIAEFSKPPHHVKWQEVNLAARLDGWTRLESAEAWLNKNQPPRATAGTVVQDSDAALFQEFLEWRRARGVR